MQKFLQNSIGPKLSASEAFRLAILSSIKNPKERIEMTRRLNEAKESARIQHETDMAHFEKVKRSIHENL